MTDSPRLFRFADDPDVIAEELARVQKQERPTVVALETFNQLVRESAVKAGLALDKITTKEAVPVESKSTMIQTSTPFQAAFDKLLGISHTKESSNDDDI